MPSRESKSAAEIYFASLELESGEARKTFLEDACAGDDLLRRDVERLFASQDKAETLFNALSPSSFSVVDLTETLIAENGFQEGGSGVLPDDGEVGKQIGPYRLVQKIGEGGGGDVYLAEQEIPVRRQVALKIIKLGMDTKAVIARFEAERQVLAMMEHPNIAHVFDAGTTAEGRPFFVMELVQGIQITTYCDQCHLEIQERLKLFIQVCHAIQHAHQKGIIHRDIKPSNIIITQLDGVAVPKVIDFGIAKAISGQIMPGQTAFTAFEQFIGTPAYMSPEQADSADMDIDIRSDIYSLGVLLYELLSGKTPFDQKTLIRSGMEAMRRTIREEEPPRPSLKLAGLSTEALATTSECRQLPPQRLLALLEGDLGWIVIKALDKNRDLRYRSADGFADDIERYLNHEAVVARPPNRLYRFRKLVRRNKVIFAAAGVTTAILILSSTVSTWLLINERIAKQRALRAEQEKGVLQKEAEVLRSSVEQLAEASVLMRHGEKEQADAIVDRVENPQASLENASVYRELGDWHALNGRWEKAKARFEVLNRINEFEATESTADDIRFASLIVEHGYLEEYDLFRESMITRYAGTDIPRIAQRVLQHSLLVPANKELMIALDQFARVTKRSIDQPVAGENKSLRGWQVYAMALFSYRRGDLEQSLYSCQNTYPNERGLPTRDYSVDLLQSMALYRLGRQEEAKIQLEATRSAITSLFSTEPSKSKIWQGFWFDRACVRILLKEAEALIER